MKKLFVSVSIWTLLAGFSGCVLKEEGYHHRHHDRVVVEEHPAVREKVEIR